jgi:diacylglycerol kinase (ATP)
MSSFTQWNPIRLKLLMIFNPRAAHGRSQRKLGEIRAEFERHGLDITVKSTARPGHGRKLVADTDLSDFDGLVAAGGDGTLFEVLNGLYEHPAAARVPLGLLPIGTGNAFSREWNNKGLSPSEAVAIIGTGDTRKIDIAQVDSADGKFYFLNIMHMGFAVAAGQTARKLKFLGNTAYTIATLWQVLKLRSYPLEIELDGRRLQAQTVFTSIANSRYTGTHFLIAPEAVIDDGKLDVISLRKLSRMRILRLFPTIYDGGHIAFDEVFNTKAGCIKLISPAGMLLGPDGEFRGRTPATIRCLHRDLTVFCRQHP